MMEFRQWLLSISICAILVGTVRHLLPQGRTGAVVQFTSGLLLLVCVLKPLGSVRFDALITDFDWKEEQLEQQDLLQSSYDERLQQSIAERTEAYIEDKARLLGISAEATATVRDNDVICVSLNAEKDEALSRYMCNELGISQERQKWRDGN